ncbi:MAG: hypothetical protein ABIL58_08195 [Pseudomonadota bacterium]
MARNYLAQDQDRCGIRRRRHHPFARLMKIFARLVKSLPDDDCLGKSGEWNRLLRACRIPNHQYLEKKACAKDQANGRKSSNFLIRDKGIPAETKSTNTAANMEKI